jgi:hypothetical protein
MALNLEAQSREQSALVLYRGPNYAVHRPSPAAGALSSWSSGLHALALRQLDPKLARAELEAIYALGQSPDGLLSDQIALPGGSLPGESGARSSFIAPPLAAYAVGVLAQDRSQDLAALLECATREVDAIWAERLPPDTPLPVILHPREAGLRRNPLFEELIDSEDDEEWEAELAGLARSALACRLDPATALRAGHAFVIEDPGFCGWLLLALEALEQAWDSRGQSATALKLRVRSSMIREAIEDRLWWEEEEIYTAYNRGRSEVVKLVTASGLVPAAARGLIEGGSAKRAIDRHLRPSGSALWCAKGIVLAPLPGGLRDEAQLPPGRIIDPAAQYWAHLALLRAGRPADARVLRAQLETLLETHGLWDAYSPLTGAPDPGAAGGALAAAIALEMRAQADSPAGYSSGAGFAQRP